MHFNNSLPTSVENGARRSMHWDNRIVRTDGGTEVRNSRWSSPLRTFELSFPNRKENDPDHLAVLTMWLTTQGGIHTFNFRDTRANETVKVRFDTDLQFTNTLGPYFHLDSFTLVEVR